jgi:8-oxo-dGTP pyrophosphatase MutT (NUDIX family)
MGTIWRGLGVISYWCGWPLLWIYLRGSVRTRVIIRYQGQILVVRTWLGNGEYNLPGGGLHAGEHADAGARREINEELHLQNVKLVLKPLGIEAHTGKGFSYMCHYFVADCTYMPDVKMQFPEIVDYAWVDPGELTTKNANPDTLRALILLNEL